VSDLSIPGAQESPKPLPVPPISPRFASYGRGPKVKGIAAGIVLVSSNASSLLPTTSGAFPEAELKLEKPESWVNRHIVKPVKMMVRKKEY
jgi:hypothetical protein